MNKTFQIFLTTCLLSFSYLFSYDPNYQNYIQQEVESFMLANNVPGVALALYYNGVPTTYTFGVANTSTLNPITNQTIFEIGSVTKVFTSTLLSLLVQNGVISCKYPISKYLKYLRAHPSNLNKIHCGQLATYTSSLPHSDNVKDSCNKTSVFNAFANWVPPFPIGSHYLYSNVGYNILGFTIEGATGKVLFDLFNEKVLQPLQMTSTFIAVPPSYMPLYAEGYNAKGLPAQRVPECLNNGAGFIRSSIDDMLNFLLANLELAGPKRLISAMVKAQKPNFRINKTLTVGLGWFQVTDKNTGKVMITKNGETNGFSSFMGMTSDKSVGIVILTNKANTQVKDLGQKILLHLAQS